MRHGLRAAKGRDSGSPITLLLPQAAAAPGLPLTFGVMLLQGGKGRTAPLPWGPDCICSLLQLRGSPPTGHPSIPPISQPAQSWPDRAPAESCPGAHGLGDTACEPRAFPHPQRSFT